MKKKIIYSLLIFSTVVCQSTVFANKTEEFFKAVENNKLEEVKKLALQIEDINATNKYGITAIHLACSKGHLEIIKYLASNKKVNFDIKTEWGAQHIHFAALSGKIKLFNYLVKEKKADIHKKDTDNVTPLWLALNYKNYEIAKIILNKSTNLNFNIPDKTNNSTPLWLALSYKQYDIAKTILNKSTNLIFNIPDNNNITPLWLTLSYKQYDIARMILQKSTNQNFNIPDNKSNATPLYIACRNNKKEIIKLLIEKGAHTNTALKNGETPIMTIIRNEKIEQKEKFELYKLLIEHGADISKKEHLITKDKIFFNKGNDAFEIAKNYDTKNKTKTAEYIIKIKFNTIIKKLINRKKSLLYQKIFKEEGCQICCNENNENKIIICHPCGHTCCTSCIKNLFLKRESKPHRCPFCSKGIIDVEYLKKAKLISLKNRLFNNNNFTNLIIKTN